MSLLLAELWLALAAAVVIGFLAGWILRWTFAVMQRRDLESTLNATRSELTACLAERALLEARLAATQLDGRTGGGTGLPQRSPDAAP